MTNEQLIQALLVIIYGITWTNVFLTVAFGFLVVLLWRLNNGTSRFGVDDLFLNEVTRRADIYKLIIAVMAGLSVWLIIKLVSIEKIDAVVTLMPIILGIFVLGRTAGSIWGKGTVAPPDPEPTPPPEGK